MSVSEDCELQELVKQTLEKSGSLSKIRAELRASVFLALEESGCFQNPATQNTNLQNFAKTADGVLLICLIREFLEYYGLSFTASVFDPELASYGIQCDCKDRSKLSSQISVTSISDDKPILSQMLKIIRNIQDEPKNQKVNPDVIKGSTKLTNCKSSDTSTEYIPLQSAVNFGNEVESKKQIKIGSEKKEVITSKNENFHDLRGKSTHAAINKETDTSKYNLASLDDLPPLTSSFTSSKSNSGASSKCKQMNMLKAALKDTITESDTSITSEDDKIDVQDSSNLDESIVEESQITAEDGSS